MLWLLGVAWRVARWAGHPGRRRGVGRSVAGLSGQDRDRPGGVRRPPVAPGIAGRAWPGQRSRRVPPGHREEAGGDGRHYPRCRAPESVSSSPRPSRALASSRHCVLAQAPPLTATPPHENPAPIRERPHPGRTVPATRLIRACGRRGLVSEVDDCLVPAGRAPERDGGEEPVEAEAGSPMMIRNRSSCPPGHPAAAPGRVGSEPSTCAFRLDITLSTTIGRGLAGGSGTMIDYVRTDEQTWSKHGPGTAIDQGNKMVKTPGRGGCAARDLNPEPAD